MTFSREATIVVGTAAEVVPLLRQMLPPSAWYGEFATFGIDESRQLKDQSARKLAPGEKQFWVVALSAITLEAQNALLKTLEEPAFGHYFVFVVSTPADLLPTLLSRCEIVHFDRPADSGAGAKFLRSLPEARLEQIQKLLKTHEGVPALTRNLSLKLVNEIERELRAGGVTPERTPYFAELARGRDYLHDRASMPRLILEHLALVLP